MGYHFLLQGIFPVQRLNPHLLYWQADSLPLLHLGNHVGLWGQRYCSFYLTDEETEAHFRDANDLDSEGPVSLSSKPRDAQVVMEGAWVEEEPLSLDPWVPGIVGYFVMAAKHSSS